MIQIDKALLSTVHKDLFPGEILTFLRLDPFVHPWTWEREGNRRFGAVQLLNTCLFVNLFSIQNEPGPHLLPATIKQNLKTAVSADCTSEMLIYIRHGTSALLSKSAENWSEAERKDPPHHHHHHPLLFSNVAKSVDYLIKEWQALEQLIKKTKISWRKQKYVEPFYFACENRFDSQLWPLVKLQMIGALKRRGTVLEHVTDGVWQVPSGRKLENSGELQQSSSSRIDLSVCVSTVCVHACLSVFFIFFFLPAFPVSFLDGSSWPIWPRKYQRLTPTSQGVFDSVCVCLCEEKMCLCRAT